VYIASPINFEEVIMSTSHRTKALVTTIGVVFALGVGTAALVTADDDTDDRPIPVEPDGGIGDTPIPVEPDGGIGDTHGAHQTGLTPGRSPLRQSP
jgi:hypothetical protein